MPKVSTEGADKVNERKEHLDIIIELVSELFLQYNKQ